MGELGGLAVGSAAGHNGVQLLHFPRGPKSKVEVKAHIRGRVIDLRIEEHTPWTRFRT